jgi:hypothetical protein
MRAKSPTPVSTPISRAGLAFKQNLDSVKHMVYLGGREIELVTAEVTRARTFLSNLGDLKTKANQAKLVRSLQRFSKAIQPRFERYKTVKLWQVVMLVTCVEAYLQDVLSAAASIGPELMSESLQHAPYADVIAAASLDELANDLRARWARGWLSDGGPTRWISRLVKMGARGYPAELAPRLELMWGIRHAVVHAAGVATADFVKRHPGVVTGAGERLQVGNRDIELFVIAVKDFMGPTEEFFLARYPSLIAEAEPERLGGESWKGSPLRAKSPPPLDKL